MALSSMSESLQNAYQYPENLVEPLVERYELQAYRKRLRTREDAPVRLFSNPGPNIAVALLEWNSSLESEDNRLS